MSANQISLVHQKLVQLIEQKYQPSPQIIQAFIDIPRHFFVSKPLQFQAYDDIALPIGERQTISQPSLVAKITDIALDYRETPINQILEIGTGSGFQAAIASQIAKRVYSCERINNLIKKAKANTTKLGIKNIYFLKENEFSLVINQKFDAIIFSAGYSGPLDFYWKDLLAKGGVMVLPHREEKSDDNQKENRKSNRYVLKSIKLNDDGQYQFKSHLEVSFVPYIKP